MWYTSLLLVFGIAFVVALNVAARLDRPEVYELRGYEIRMERVGPGGALNVQPPTLDLAEVEDNLYSQNLDRLRLWSAFAVVGLALASGAAGYVLSGIMLRPVRDITEVASEISATNLSRRINHQGPDDELKQLADTFDSMIGRLEETFEQQRQFVQDASHELRTPLAAIRTNIEVAEMDQYLSEDETRTLLETIKAQTARLTRLSDDLLMLSTNERGAPELRRLQLLELARDVTLQLTPLAAARDVVLHVDGDASLAVEGNPDSLFRALSNLVDNAIKYSGEGKQVWVSVQRTGHGPEVRVRDNGPGVPEEQRDRIFERFYRVDKGRSRAEGGTGLGLAIVRELVESMGGRVSLETATGEGSTFIVRLREAAPSVQESSGFRDGAAHRGVLVEE
ncbi:MAG: ATP-binding protein [Dehalococcoidia bacterium]|nr:ATP-binding protein [Dehalococcoidia bacterium]